MQVHGILSYLQIMSGGIDAAEFPKCGCYWRSIDELVKVGVQFAHAINVLYILSS